MHAFLTTPLSPHPLSQSGGTFSSLAVSNLVTAYTDNIFVVSSEWDTQIGKNLREVGRTHGTARHGTARHGTHARTTPSTMARTHLSRS